MTTYFCMRHGLTDWNADKRIQGQTDVGLCAEGCAMAEAWATSLADNEFDRILTSGLKRAVQTAEILNARLNLPVHADPRLAEQDWGEWTGKSAKEMGGLGKPLRRQESRGFAFCPPGGESRDEVLMRACDALIEFAAEHPEDRVLVVTHNGVLKCLAYALSGLEFLPSDPLPILPYRLHRIECMDNEIALGESNMEL